ncbi:MAG: c-type cytochrome [Planctomycetaceae bacterium]
MQTVRHHDSFYSRTSTMPHFNRFVLSTAFGTALVWMTSASFAAEQPKIDRAVQLLEFVLDADESTARHCLQSTTSAIQNGSVDAERMAALRAQLSARLKPIVQQPDHPLRFDAALLTTALGDPTGLEYLRSQVSATSVPTERRLAALRALVSAQDAAVGAAVQTVLNDSHAEAALRTGVVEALGRWNDQQVATLLLSSYSGLAPDIRPKAIEVLTQRPAWTKPLLAAVAAKRIDKDAINLNQLRRINTFKDQSVRQTLKDLYGEIREGRDPGREQVFYKSRDFLNGTPGDPFKGEAVFTKVCGQCHKLYGEGAEVGPDITRNGRNNWDQLLWNVLDPSQVIGPGYQARILITTDGRTLTGLPVEESDQRVILKVQGGKQETIPRDQIEVYKVSELSLMPDQLEKQLTPQELADLLSFLAYDKHPSDPEAKRLSGAPAPQTK